ncbi:MAG: DUF1987 domain-containing protein [Bacteroidota bacterium]|nr:DUF1987 domain-containing protein [Bacteroidota bacterium]MDP3146584.1 DUF1987 domain-containing protein [Bacteroidota bacterium]
MKNLVIPSTKKTPEIIFKASGDLMISGSSLPVNIKDFYQPILDWLEELKNSNPSTVSLAFDLDQINTSSTRIFLQIIRLIDTFNDGKFNFSIAWHYDKDDEDLLELGKGFQEIINRKFDFIEK